jgi:DNA-directed RNA polymerase subunit L
MDIDILKEEKNEIEVRLGSLTIAEILRVYLNNDTNVKFVAWKRAHPTENPILRIETSGKSPKKAIKDAIGVLTKDLDKFEGDFSKLK